MFHNNTILNECDEIKRKDDQMFPYITPECNSWDESGFCKGHEMNREEFIKTYCNGTTPSQLESRF